MDENAFMAVLERIAAAVEFLAVQQGHVPKTAALAPTESGQTAPANTEEASG